MAEEYEAATEVTFLFRSPSSSCDKEAGIGETVKTAQHTQILARHRCAGICVCNDQVISTAQKTQI